MEIVDVLRVEGYSRRYLTFLEFTDAAAEDGFDDPARMWDHWKTCDFDVLIARDGSRFAREQSIFAEVVTRTINSGASLYMLTEGWIDAVNGRAYSAIAGYSAAVAVDRLIAGQRDTKIKNASRGLTTGSRVPYSHKWVQQRGGQTAAHRTRRKQAPPVG